MRISFSMSRRNGRSSASQNEIAMPVGAGARGAADAVHVALGNVRQVVVDHMADAVDVDAARGDVGRDQRAHACRRGKSARAALALVLRLVAVDGVGGEAGLGQPAHDLVGAVLGAGEDQRAIDRLRRAALRRAAPGLPARSTWIDALLDSLDRGGRGRDRDLHRIVAACGWRDRRSRAAWWPRRTASGACAAAWSRSCGCRG